MFHDYSRFEKKNGGHRIRFFRNWGRKLQFFADFCMCFNCKSTGSLHQTVVAKKLYLEFFSKTTRTFLIHFSFNRERKKWGSPCSFSLYEQNCLLSSLTRMRETPNMAGPNNPLHSGKSVWHGLLHSLWFNAKARTNVNRTLNSEPDIACRDRDRPRKRTTVVFLLFVRYLFVNPCRCESNAE